MGKSMDFGADGRVDLRAVLGRCILVAAGRRFFFAMFSISEEPVRRSER